MNSVWSYGGGVQSAAIGVLIATGKLPKPDHIVMADTGREAQATWDYLRNAMNPYLTYDAGISVEVIREFKKVDLYSKKSGKPLIPAYSAGGGQLENYCSNEWKKRVVDRWMRSIGIRQAEVWLGISTDELHRAKVSDVKWKTLRYPLLTDVPMTRAECIALVRSVGLPTPPRSSCWMCPYRSQKEWDALRDTPDWKKAVALDKEIRADGLYVHRDRVPLSNVKPSGDEQGSLTLDVCESGYCWT